MCGVLEYTFIGCFSSCDAYILTDIAGDKFYPYRTSFNRVLRSGETFLESGKIALNNEFMPGVTHKVLIDKDGEKIAISFKIDIEC